MQISDIKRAYFLGIGGIGMSAIARYFNDKSVQVFGYDRDCTPLTKTLEAEGMEIHYETSVDAIPDNIDIIVYTPAIPQDHAEYAHLDKSDIPMYKRSEVLGLISRDYRTIAVAGTHGKTSTSTILAHLLVNSGVESINFLGGIHRGWQSNYTYGESGWLVAEADEYDRSFLRLFPEIAVILSMDADHLDIYGTPQGMIDAYEQFTRQIQDGGTLIIKYGIEELFSDSWSNDMTARNIQVLRFGDAEADIWVTENTSIGFATAVSADILSNQVTWQWDVPGYYNASNASIAWAIATQIGCSDEELQSSIQSYEGVKRRIEHVYQVGETMLIDDYAHHPEELRSVISAVRQIFPGRQLVGIFQPHLYSRTKDHFEGFAEALSMLDRAYVLPIYPARELPIEGITSEMIVEQMTLHDAEAVRHNDLKEKLRIDNNQITITLGAGNLEKHHQMIINKIEEVK